MDLFSSESESFVKAVVDRLQQRLCLPGDFVVSAGDIGAEMYVWEEGEKGRRGGGKTERRVEGGEEK